MVYTANNIDSSLIKSIYFDDEKDELTIVFAKYYITHITYCGVNRFEYNKLISADSIGSYYLSYIKNKFKMSEETTKKASTPSGVNNSSDKKRYIQMRLNVDKINKNLIFSGKSGNYLDITLHLLPDGTVDKYENLGFITQDKAKDSKEVTEILGNGRENLWKSEGSESTPGSSIGNNIANVDDLPF